MHKPTLIYSPTGDQTSMINHNRSLKTCDLDSTTKVKWEGNLYSGPTVLILWHILRVQINIDSMWLLILCDSAIVCVCVYYLVLGRGGVWDCLPAEFNAFLQWPLCNLLISLNFYHAGLAVKMHNSQNCKVSRK